MLELKTEYRGYEIEWSDYHKALVIHQGENKSTKTLFYNTDDCEKWIDEQYLKKFQKVEVYRYVYYDTDFYEGFVDVLTYNNKRCRFTDKNTGDRSIQNRGNIFPATDHNTNIVNEIFLKKKAVSNLEKQIEGLVDEMVMLQPGDVEIIKKGE